MYEMEGPHSVAPRRLPIARPARLALPVTGPEHPPRTTSRLALAESGVAPETVSAASDRT
jgi:hypothetical protein